MTDRPLPPPADLAPGERSSPTGTPYCPYCHSQRVYKAGWINGQQRYRCKDCGKRTYGHTVPLGRPPGPWKDIETKRPTQFHCPNCGGRCQRHGRNSAGRQVYLCVACCRSNTELWRTRPRSRGPFPHRLTLHLNPTARHGLLVYANRHRLHLAAAIRAIFHAAAHEPPIRIATARAYRDSNGHLRCRIRHAAGPTLFPNGLPILLPPRIPDARPAALAKRLAQPPGYRSHYPTVLVACSILVKLDDLALAGLLYYAQNHGLTHQEAARALLSEQQYI